MSVTKSLSTFSYMQGDNWEVVETRESCWN